MDEQQVFIARYSNTTIKGESFSAVGDVLQERGFLMARAAEVEPRVLAVPHRNPRRPAAKILVPKHNGAQHNGAEHNGAVKEPVSVEVAAAELTHTAITSGAQQPVGLQTRECGAVHSDGVVCFIAVLYEQLTCECGLPLPDDQYIYEHDGPHEAVDRDGVRYRWEQILIIKDLPYDAYCSREEYMAKLQEAR